MGPFELMDLVGLDVGLAVSRSFYEQSFGEPRWRPSPLVAQRVAAGHLGRKSRPRLVRVPAGPARRPRAGRRRPRDDRGPLDELRAGPPRPVGRPSTRRQPSVPPLRRAWSRSTAATSSGEPRASASSPRSACTSSAWATSCSPRIVAQLVNEACFALGEGIGSAADIDAGMELGLNHPRGPLAWGDLIGPRPRARRARAASRTSTATTAGARRRACFKRRAPVSH